MAPARRPKRYKASCAPDLTVTTGDGCCRKSSSRILLPAAQQSPPEILQHIFRFTAQLSSQDELPINTSLITSRVCRYWRDVTLADCALWTHLYIAPGRLDDAEVYFNRSKVALMHVVIFTNGDVDYAYRISRLFERHSHRLATLRLSSDIPQFTKTSLSVDLSPTTVGLSPPDGTSFSIIFNSVYRFPRLRELDLTTDGTPPLDTLFAVLRSCQSLKKLSLRRLRPLCDLNSSELDIEGIETISLPQLEHLTIQDHSKVTASYVMNLLSFPVSTNVEVSFGDRGTPPFNADETAFQSKQTSVRRAEIRYTTLEDPSLDAAFWAVSLRSKDLSNQFSVAWRWYGDPLELAPASDHMGDEIFDLTSLTSLEVFLERAWPPDTTWTRWMHSLRSLRKLVIHLVDFDPESGFHAPPSSALRNCTALRDVRVRSELTRNGFESEEPDS